MLVVLYACYFKNLDILKSSALHFMLIVSYACYFKNLGILKPSAHMG